MTASEPPSNPPCCVAVFDLDGTLTWRDTLLGFLVGYARRRPSRWIRLWRLPVALARYLHHHDRGLLKSHMIRIVMGGDSQRMIDGWADDFVTGLKARGVFRSAALAVLETHRTAGDRLVLLSASPDLYVPRIGRLLGFERTICTEVRWQDHAGTRTLDGALVSANRRGEEKARCLAWLRTQYSPLLIVAYGNSAADLPHMTRADRALLVNAGGAAQRRATAAGIPIGEWR